MRFRVELGSNVRRFVVGVQGPRALIEGVVLSVQSRTQP